MATWLSGGARSNKGKAPTDSGAKVGGSVAAKDQGEAAKNDSKNDDNSNAKRTRRKSNYSDKRQRGPNGQVISFQKKDCDESESNGIDHSSSFQKFHREDTSITLQALLLSFVSNLVAQTPSPSVQYGGSSGSSGGWNNQPWQHYGWSQPWQNYGWDQPWQHYGWDQPWQHHGWHQPNDWSWQTNDWNGWE